jgi:hypothetical protein
MATDEKPNPWASLSQSRKSIVALGALLVAGGVMVAGILTKTDKELVVTYVLAVSALAFKMLDAIAREDAAKTAGAAQVAIAKIASVRPPPVDDARTRDTIPPGARVPQEMRDHD